MNKIMNKFLLTGNKLMPEMHLGQPGYLCSACGSFTKNKKRIQKFKETGYSKYIDQNELDKSCFQHDISYGDFKDLPRRTTSNKVFCDKEFNIAKNPKYDSYHSGLASMVYKFLDKRSSGGAVVSEIMPNKQLVKELYKPIISKFEKPKLYSSFKDNIWSADLADMQLLSEFNNRICFLLFVADA